MKTLADAHRADRQFEPGDLVLLSTKHYRLKKPHRSEKFLPLYVGPFKVLRRIGQSAYKIELPESSKVHPVIHVSKLWKYRSDLRCPEPPPTVFLDDAEKFEVLDILAERGEATRKQYLVQWKGRDVMYNTWEPEDRLSMCTDALRRYHERPASIVPQLRSECFYLSAESATLPLPPRA